MMFMWTGHAPFDDANVRATFNERVRSDELLGERIRERVNDPPVAALLMAAMTADPAARIPSAADFFKRMREALHAPPPAPKRAPTPVPPMRPPQDSLTTALESVKIRDGQPEPVSPAERARALGAYRVRLVEVNEMLELTREHEKMGELRVRVTMLPVKNEPLRVHIKGLNCFVSWTDPGSRPTPAIVAQQDGAVDLISALRERVGRISWSFGTRTHTGHVFVVDGQELVVPYADATHAVVLHLGDDRELVVMCRR
jgi:hypothetical protein